MIFTIRWANTGAIRDAWNVSIKCKITMNLISFQVWHSQLNRCISGSKPTPRNSSSTEWLQQRRSTLNVTEFLPMVYLHAEWWFKLLNEWQNCIDIFHKHDWMHFHNWQHGFFFFPFRLAWKNLSNSINSKSKRKPLQNAMNVNLIQPDSGNAILTVCDV